MVCARVCVCVCVCVHCKRVPSWRNAKPYESMLLDSSVQLQAAAEASKMVLRLVTAWHFVYKLIYGCFATQDSV